ncbi:aminopeptidase P SCDLUD_001356 [Saccharomycodes ludwigii]|uniref:aminopeptidase P n=1 Tax=Saccharomycodes ludwigii TaxID=36035 RepID=UPI001E853B59|nr:hypothetical protein SCDLUD_001356 [Saccharomycodes ludwigii]KAH3901593.1 hypothetical protein SCDLUD_001356 [Saccharomycodes ludwigii]
MKSSNTTAKQPFKPCDNCTCSRGLLYRQQSRRSILFRQISRRSSLLTSTTPYNVGSNTSINDEDSVYSSDQIGCSSRNINTTKRLLSLRKEMIKKDLCCYIVPSEDEHQSEYVSFADQRRAFISGFTGSAGVACITRDVLNFNLDAPEGKCVLSTDGRYFNQATQELDYNWSLLRQGVDKTTWEEWCVNEAYEMSKGLGNSKKKLKIGIDPKLITIAEVSKFQKLIEDKDYNNCVELVPVETNLIDLIWDQFEDAPSRALKPLFMLDEEKFAGEPFVEKRNRLLKYLDEKHKNGMVSDSSPTFISIALDEISWFTNLRGEDIDYNPVFYSYLIVTCKDTLLYTDNEYSSEIKEYFARNNIIVKPYNDFWKELERLSATNNTASTNTIAGNKSSSILIPNNSSWAIVNKLKNNYYRAIESPLEVFKAVKNHTEICNARKAQVKDGVALVQYFSWLENELVKKQSLIDEYKASCKLTSIRETQSNFRGNSFETISSTGSNAAIIHYSPSEENCSMIDPLKIYLCDSGSQFLEGTTDITRTFHFTEPKQEEIDNYTLVLKGNLALERLIIPEGTSGYNIDVIARQFLWSQGLDYRHGTGHGVGSYLNVHEGPIGIGFRPHLVEFPLKEGNIITNEPGYYKDGEYGIRIENDMLVVKTDLKFGDKGFLKFENLTLVPYCKKLINVKMLTSEEKRQINEYHTRVWASIVPFLQPQSLAYKWLKRETSKIK